MIARNFTITGPYFCNLLDTEVQCLLVYWYITLYNTYIVRDDTSDGTSNIVRVLVSSFTGFNFQLRGLQKQYSRDCWLRMVAFDTGLNDLPRVLVARSS